MVFSDTNTPFFLMVILAIVSRLGMGINNPYASKAALMTLPENKIVEAISKVGSVEEARVIYESLQSTVGTSRKSTGPKSLSEAVSRPSSLHARRKSSGEQSNPLLERMQVLAGIKNK